MTLPFQPLQQIPRLHHFLPPVRSQAPPESLPLQGFFCAFSPYVEVVGLDNHIVAAFEAIDAPNDRGL